MKVNPVDLKKSKVIYSKIERKKSKTIMTVLGFLIMLLVMSNLAYFLIDNMYGREYTIDQDNYTSIVYTDIFNGTINKKQKARSVKEDIDKTIIELESNKESKNDTYIEKLKEDSLYLEQYIKNTTMINLVDITVVGLLFIVVLKIFKIYKAVYQYKREIRQIDIYQNRSLSLKDNIDVYQNKELVIYHFINLELINTVIELLALILMVYIGNTLDRVFMYNKYYIIYSILISISMIVFVFLNDNISKKAINSINYESLTNNYKGIENIILNKW